jgi:hypothetical protein
MAEIKVTSLRQRILWRAVPVGLATGLIGYLLLQLYVPIARYMYRDLEVHQGDVMGMIRGCALFALAGFVVAAALECVRKEKK